ncbi:alpha-N-acetylgalactosaminide alpha-2,6-sialyltransferase 2 isoform X4 [Phyllostomus discolor]|uniref:alpha-N-acetylgalactosaminide alpha-2,6-sialyltransferase n=1 Tax=Phyllostomus discolor TaxID=89673 RepID=A0A7E6EF77_9CHIR|nr:alpha-N-acetylgalactosaminide alpha-2,6-sialyltransferase 2 isoform X4 [Phyllostomus discolor]
MAAPEGRRAAPGLQATRPCPVHPVVLRLPLPSSSRAGKRQRGRCGGKGGEGRAGQGWGRAGRAELGRAAASRRPPRSPGPVPSAPGPRETGRPPAGLHGAPARPALLASAPALGLLLGDPLRPVLLRGEATPGAPVRSQGRPCGPPLALAAQRHPRFRGLFDFSRPVLLSGGLYTQQLWDSLSQRKAPYGWQGLSRQDVISTLSLLNGSESAQLFGAGRKPRQDCVRCAVVGNGGILNGSRQGLDIDAHDYVFRLRAGCGHQDLLLRFHREHDEELAHLLREAGLHLGAARTGSLSPRQDLRYIFIPSDLRDYVMLRAAVLGEPVRKGPDQGDRPQTYFGPEASAGKFKLLHPDFISYLTQRFLKSRLMNTNFGDLYMPSTGALMLLTALHTCDQVSAFGFITSNYWKFSDHYFDRVKKPLVFYANHDLSLEAALWRDLHVAGILRLYQR